MATVKIKFRASSSEMREGTLYFQVIHKREVRQIRTGYKLYKQEWDATCCEVVLPDGICVDRRNYLVSLNNAVQEDSRRLRNLVSRLEISGNGFTADDIVSTYKLPSDRHCFISFARSLIEQLREIGKTCTADTYTTTVNSFVRFRKECDILLEDVDSDLMMAYETYLKSIGICPNSTSFYMRNLRAIYNRAVERADCTTLSV